MPSALTETLELLDLRKCETVSDVVQGMSKCSFGARMLGEVAETLTGMIGKKKKPTLVYDGKPDTPLGTLLKSMVDKGWFERTILPEDNQKLGNDNVVVVGQYSERHADALHERPKRSIFINDFGIAKPGQVKDGHFPDAVFSDPRFVMPVLYHVLEERLGGKKAKVKEMFDGLMKFGGTATEVAQGAEVTRAMVEDPKCTVFMTLSGAMTVAQMSLVITDMIDLGMVQYIASTGALMAHGLVPALGKHHYKYHPKFSDKLLAARKINRVTDTLEPERNLDHLEKILHRVMKAYSGEQVISPRILHEGIGKYLHEKYPDKRAILTSAYEKGVPILVPAFHDSEIGNDLYIHNKLREKDGEKPIKMDMELDTDHLRDMVLSADRLGIFTVGGGVPRNFTQNIAPLIELLNVRLKEKNRLPQFNFGTRICPDQMYYGHLSGCTYSEGMTWRKFALDAMLAEVHTDATQVWPFYVKDLMDRK